MKSLPANQPAKIRLQLAGIASLLALLSMANVLQAGHSRSCYLDAGQSVDGRYVVTANRSDTFDKKGKRIDHRWTFTWFDRQSDEKHEGKLLGLRTGTDNVFDPVNAHIFVASGGETFALWMPQSGARAANKNPGTDDRSSDEFQSYEGFGYRLTIYKKTGEVVKRFDLKDLLHKADWAWMHFHGRQVYWLVEYEKFDTRKTPRSGHALYRISPDYTVLEFQVGANQEAAYKAKHGGITPPEPRIVRVRLTDGRIITDEELVDSNNVPVRPFVGDLANKERPQYAYEPSLDPVRVPGRFVERDRTNLPVRLGRSSPPVKIGGSERCSGLILSLDKNQELPDEVLAGLGDIEVEQPQTRWAMAVFGCVMGGHHGGNVNVAEGQADHPIIQGLDDLWQHRMTKRGYKYKQMAADVKVLIESEGMPQIWVRDSQPGTKRRLVYVGYDPEDFDKHESLRRLMARAVFWAAGKKYAKRTRTDDHRGS